MDLICNFTDSYHKLKECDNCSTILHFNHIEQTNGYCSDEAADEIRNRLKGHSFKGEHYIDDGNHHYFSLFFLEKIDEPFNLIVFDHHTDMQPSALLPILSCGNWILECLKKIPALHKVYILGPPADAISQAKNDTSFNEERVVFIDEMDANESPVEIPNDLPVYISVDEDVLDASEFTSIWDQGSMSRHRLEELLNSIRSRCRVLGIDYCG